jgi:hypothetical protein
VFFLHTNGTNGERRVCLLAAILEMLPQPPQFPARIAYSWNQLYWQGHPLLHHWVVQISGLWSWLKQHAGERVKALKACKQITVRTQQVGRNYAGGRCLSTSLYI